MTTRLDIAFLEDHASISSDGIEERAFFMDIAGSRCFALLARPAEPKDLGFVVCHSYGLELLTLRRVERGVARALAGLGYPVLSFHRRGYGDSSGSLADATLEWHLEDIRAAGSHLAAETGVERLGLIGARFGGLMAGLAARYGGIDRLLLIDPQTRGEAYFRRSIKEMHMVQVTTGDGGAKRSTDEILEDLRRDGMIDVLGNPIHRHLFEALADVDLSADVGAFSGDALLMQVSKGSAALPEYESFRSLVEEGGGTCRIELVREPPGARFGGPAYVTVNDTNVRVDVQAPIATEICRLAKEWMSL